MKKALIFFGIITIIVITNCTKQSELKPEIVDKKIIVREIFSAGMSWNASINELKSSLPVNAVINNTIAGPEGGNIQVFGSVTGTMSIDDHSGEIIGGTLQLQLTETVNDYAFIYDGSKFTMKGNPDITSAGTFTLMPGGYAFETPSNMQFIGEIRIVGPNFDKIFEIGVMVSISSDGRGGNVTGTINGEKVNYSF